MGIVRFEDKYVRKTEHEGDIYFSVEDLVAILTDSVNPKDYIKKCEAETLNYQKGGDKLSPPLCCQLLEAAKK